MARHNDLGKEGEQRAVDYLISHGYRVVDRNWKAPRSCHELDIIAMKDERLVVVEVKTRSDCNHGTPLDAVDRQKMRYLVSAANSYVHVKQIDLPIRFDVIGIVDNEIVHVRNAFVPQAKYYR